MTGQKPTSFLALQRARSLAEEASRAGHHLTVTRLEDDCWEIECECGIGDRVTSRREGNTYALAHLKFALGRRTV